MAEKMVNESLSIRPRRPFLSEWWTSWHPTWNPFCSAFGEGRLRWAPGGVPRSPFRPARRGVHEPEGENSPVYLQPGNRVPPPDRGGAGDYFRGHVAGGLCLGTAGAVMVLLGAFGLRMLLSTGRASSFLLQAWAFWFSTCWWEESVCSACSASRPLSPGGSFFSVLREVNC